MALKTVILGWETDVLINIIGSTPTAFGVHSGSVEISADLEECGDSLDGQYKAFKPGRFEGDASFDFYEKSDVATRSGTFSMAEGDEIELTIYPDGIGGARNPYVFQSFVVGKYRNGWSMDGKFEGTISGKGNGTFSEPN